MTSATPNDRLHPLRKRLNGSQKQIGIIASPSNEEKDKSNGGTSLKHPGGANGKKHRRTRSWASARRKRREERSAEQQNNTVTQSGTQVFLPRMILRNMPYRQSNNQCQVINENKRSKNSSSTGLNRLLLSDWFHVMLRLKPQVSLLMLLTAWVGMILVFACIYIRIDTIYEDADCGLGEPPERITFAAAFAFSLETCTTVGYGLPGNSNAFFESNCNGVQATIFFQMTWSMLFNAFLFAFFYSQLSKSECRSMQLVFSDKLCINVSGRNVFASVKCYDIDSAFPVVEAHARMYLLNHKLEMNPLRLTQPDDNLGAMLYPSIPQKIIHHIDRHSALAPTRGDQMPFQACSKSQSLIPLRSCDSVTAAREEIVCPICGDSFGSYDRLANHVRFNKMIERQEKYPIKDSHQELEMPDSLKPLTLQEVTDHIEKTMSEIVVVVEGIDPQLSGTFQAIQSYKYEDIVFGADHERCTSVTADNKIVVDMRTFHRVRYNKMGRTNDSNDEGDEDLSPKPSTRDQHLGLSPFSFSSEGDETSLDDPMMLVQTSLENGLISADIQRGEPQKTNSASIGGLDVEEV